MFASKHLLVFSLVLLLLTPSSILAEPLSIEIRPNTARQSLARDPEQSVSRVAGSAAESGLETVKALGDNPAPVQKGTPVVPGKQKSSESGTPGLDGFGNLPRGGGPPPNIPNAPNFPPPQLPQPPQLCQMLLGLLQQMLAQQNQQNQNAAPQNGGAEGEAPGGQTPGTQAPGSNTPSSPPPSVNPGSIFNPGNCGPGAST